VIERARAWVEAVHPHARHLLRTEEWLLELDPDAGEALRLAAVLHDIERAFPDPSSSWESWRDWNNPEYNRWHQDRCADIAAAWLREQVAPEALTAEVERLVRVHEQGGWREADLLQAADSLSFLETMGFLVARWPRANAEAKLHDCVARMAPDLDRARALGAPLLADALAALGAPAR
jgi:hypothetical protein